MSETPNLPESGICSAGSCEWCGCEFRRPSDVMYHRCAAMQEGYDVRPCGFKHGEPLPDEDEMVGLPVMAPNQHDDAVNAASTRLALVGALHHWEKSQCDCCSPTVCDDAIEAIGYDVAFWDRMRRFGIELAQAAQNVIDQESEAPHSPEGER